MGQVLVNRGILKAVLENYEALNDINSQAFTIEQKGLGQVEVKFRYSVDGPYAEKHSHWRRMRINRYGLILDCEDTPIT